MDYQKEKMAAAETCLNRLATRIVSRHWGKLLTQTKKKCAVHPSVLQDMLHSFGAHRRMMSILKLRRRKITQGASDARKMRIHAHNDILDKLRLHCLFFLERFVRDHEPNQDEMHKHKTLFLELLDAEAAQPQVTMKLRDAVLRLLAAMYRNNAELIKTALPEALVWRLAHLMQRSEKKQFYTHFFSVLCTLIQQVMTMSKMEPRCRE